MSGIQSVKPYKLTKGMPKRVQGITSQIGDLKLRGERMTGKIDQSIVGAPFTRSIEGASTIELHVHDPDRDLLNSPLFKRRIDVELDSLWFRLVAFGRAGDTTKLTFEDRVVALQRAQKGAVKASPGKLTRAEFCVSLLREVKPTPPIWVPELHTLQPIEGSTQGRKAKRESEVTRGRGLDSGAGGLTVKGDSASKEQLKNADRALRVAESRGAPKVAMVALVMALIQESLIKNLSYGHSSSVGVLQLLDIHGSTSFRRDIEKVVALFLTKGFTGRGGAIALAKSINDPAEICSAVQGNAAGASDYRPWESEAKRWVDAFGGGGGDVTVSREVEKDYQFERGAKENSWDCVGRLMEEVRWRRFVSAGIIYLIAETDLLASKVRLRVNPETRGIDPISDFDIDFGKKLDELSITGRALRWAAPPGTVVLVSDYGPADGRYIVTEIEGSLYDDDITATLRRPQKPLPEPAPETTTRSITVSNSKGRSGSGGGSGPSGVTIGSTSAGAPAWGGSKAVFDQFINEFMRDKGLAAGSTKRSYNTGSGVSDHYVGATLAYAVDYPTTNGESAARALAKALGNNSWAPNSYATFNVKIGGQQFRVQILFGGGISHGDHVHCGVLRI